MSNVRKKYNRRDMLRVLGCTAGSAFAAPLFYGCADSDDTVQSTTDSLQEKFWLHDNYAPVGESESFNLTVEGSLPPSLLGSYLRVGPNPSSGDSAHLFLEDGMVHGVRLDVETQRCTVRDILKQGNWKMVLGQKKALRHWIMFLLTQALFTMPINS
jgi:hypothetical protein